MAEMHTDTTSLFIVVFGWLFRSGQYLFVRLLLNFGQSKRAYGDFMATIVSHSDWMEVDIALVGSVCVDKTSCGWFVRSNATILRGLPCQWVVSRVCFGGFV